MNGTQKQIEWAESIKAEFRRLAEEEIEFQGADLPEVAAGLREGLEAVLRVEESRFWIDHIRGAKPYTVLRYAREAAAAAVAGEDRYSDEDPAWWVWIACMQAK